MRFLLGLALSAFTLSAHAAPVAKPVSWQDGGVDFDGAASFHGNLGTRQPAASGVMKSPVLVMNGADDTFVSPEQIVGFQKEMTQAGADWQFVNYSGAVHCFAEPDEDGSVISGCKFHEPSYRRSMTLMRSFFAERFAQ